MLFSVLVAGSVSAAWRQQIGQALQAMLNATVGTDAARSSAIVSGGNRLRNSTMVEAPKGHLLVYDLRPIKNCR